MDNYDFGTQYQDEAASPPTARPRSDSSAWGTVAQYLLFALIAAVACLWLWIAVTYRRQTMLLHLFFLLQLGAVSLTAWLMARVRGGYSQELDGLRFAIDAASTKFTASDQSQKLFREIIEDGGIGWYRVSPEGRLMGANAALAKMLGFKSPDRLKEHYARSTFPDAAGRSAIVRALKAVGDIKRHASTWTDADGARVEVIETARGLKDAAGRMVIIEGFLFSATKALTEGDPGGDGHAGVDAAQLVADLEAARNKIGVLEDAVSTGDSEGRFVAHMSHELRTPINAIVGMANLLADTEIDPEQRDFIDTIRISSESLLSVVNNVLDYSKIEADRLQLETRPFELRACAEHAIDLVGLRAAEKSLQLIYSQSPEAPEVLIGDEVRIRQILINLLTNAVKFTHEGEIRVDVEARQLEGASHEYSFSVSDTGIGIPADRQAALFTPFYQTESSTSREYGGTGLGLAISRLLAQEMGGDLAVESVSGQGSTFRFTIRAKAAQSRADDAYRETLHSLRGRSILLVQDNDSMRRMALGLLESFDLRVTATGNPAEALDWLRDDPKWDAVVVGLSHFGQDPLVFARRLRAMEEGEAIPLILMRSITASPVFDPPFRSCTLTTPLKRGRLIEALSEALEPDQNRESKSPTERIRRSERKLSVLIAEDDAINQKVMLRVLERLGHHAEVVGSGDLVLDAVLHTHYDALLLDVRMPGMTGPEAAQAVVSRFPSPDQRPRLIGMTASTSPEERMRCLDAGMDVCLTKPIQLDDLSEELDKAETHSDEDADMQGPSEEEIRASVRRQLTSNNGDEPAFMAELLTSFLRTAPTLLKNLEAQLGKGDLKSIHRTARTLKSSCQFIGLMRLAALCKALEVSAAGQAGRADLEPFIRTIAGEFGRIRPVLSDERRSLLRRADLAD